MREDPQTRDALFELTVFLATAARGSIEEGVFTASYRLADAIRRLITIFPELTENPFFADLSEILSGPFRTSYLQSEADYIKILDQIVACTAQEIRRVTDIDAAAPD